MKNERVFDSLSLLINIDGGSRGNPGPSGAGVVVRDATSKAILYEGGLFLGKTTNNVAEYSGLLAGLKIAQRAGASSVTIISDSELLVRQMTGRYRVKSPNLLDIYAEASALAASFKKCTFRHVLREDNAHADEMANLAMDRKHDVVRVDNLPKAAIAPAVGAAKTAALLAEEQSQPASNPKIYCVQHDIAWEDKTANFDKIAAMLAKASIAPLSLIVLPEMFATGFSFNVPAVAESAHAQCEQFLAGLARQYRSTVIGGLARMGAGGKALNQAVAFGSDGGEVARFTKLHSFSYEGEGEHFAHGQDIAVFEWNGLTASPFICYDLRFPEVFRWAAQQGASLLLVLANWPSSRQEHWTTLLKARAIENQAYVVGVNRTGRSPKNTYAGGSQIISPRGQVLAEAGDEETVISSPVDAAALAAYRKEFPALKDMRP